MPKRSYSRNISMNENGTMNVFAGSATHFNLRTDIIFCKKKITLNSHNPELESYYFIITFADNTDYLIECWDSIELSYIAQEFISREFRVLP